MAKKLFETKDRDASHKKLAAILKSGEHPAAECREDPNAADGLFYSVWDGPEPPYERPPDEAEARLSKSAEDALVDRLVKKLGARLGVK